MLPNRVSTAQIADEILNDFYVKTNHDLLRQKHNKRVRKKLDRLGPIEGVREGMGQQLSLSQSLQELPSKWSASIGVLTRGSNSNTGTNYRKGRPGSKSVSFGSDEVHDYQVVDGDDDSSISSLNSSTAQLLAKHNPNFKDHHRVSDMMHRVTFQSGRPAGEKADGHALVKDEEDDNVSIAANAREIQYDGMKDSVQMQQIMREILDLHNEVTGLTKELTFRKDLVGRIDFANTTYVRLFERMLAETLLLQRSKFKSQTKKIQEMKALLAELTIKEQAGRESATRNANSAQRMEIESATLAKTISQLQDALSQANLRIAMMEEEKATLTRQVQNLKGGMSDKERNDLINAIRAEEQMRFMKEMQLMKKQWAKEADRREALLRKEIAEMPKGVSLADLTKAATKTSDFKRPKADADTQTEVDEEGVWDRKDGWTLPIKGTIIARHRWREAYEFAKCPGCHGVGNFIALAAKLLRSMQRGTGNVFMDDAKKGKGKTGAVWQIPDELVRFMSNLPRSVMAISPKPITWVIRRIWNLLNKKAEADETDDNLGLPLQEVEEHLVESYLIRSEKRSDAELEIWVLINTMKEHYKKSGLIHGYARFLQILNGLSVEQIKNRDSKKSDDKVKERQKELERKTKKMSARERTNYARAEADKEQKRKEREQGKPVVEESLPMCDASLSLGILGVYHFARKCLLEPYLGGYARKIKEMKDTLPVLIQPQTKLIGSASESKEWPIKIPDHVLIDSKYQFFIPLDRALRVTQAIICFLEDSEYQAALRSLEHAVVFLQPDGEIRLPEGMHTEVRSTVRSILSVENPDGRDMMHLELYQKRVEMGAIPRRDEQELGPMTEEELENGKDIILTSLDVTLRVICECLLYRTRFVESRLADIFVEGDLNKDGVLSFSEFMAIVSSVAPHFPDRRILRMYREALSMGNDDDTIGPVAFVETCKKHGLVSLVDLREIKAGSLKALSKSEEEKVHEREIAQAVEDATKKMKEKQALAMFQTGHRNPSERAQARRNSTLEIMSRKGLGNALAAMQGGSGSPQIGSSSPVRKGSVLGGGGSPLAMAALSALKQSKSQEIEKESPMAKLRRASSVGQGSDLSKNLLKSLSSKGPPSTSISSNISQGSMTDSDSESEISTEGASPNWTKRGIRKVEENITEIKKMEVSTAVVAIKEEIEDSDSDSDSISSAESTGGIIKRKQNTLKQEASSIHGHTSPVEKVEKVKSTQAFSATVQNNVDPFTGGPLRKAHSGSKKKSSSEVDISNKNAKFEAILSSLHGDPEEIKQALFSNTEQNVSKSGIEIASASTIGITYANEDMQPAAAVTGSDMKAALEARKKARLLQRLSQQADVINNN